MNVVNIIFNICGIVFLTFLMAVYFTKKNMPNIENKIYKNILVLSLLITVSDLLFWLSCYYMKDYLFTVQLTGRIYLVFLIMWLVFLTYYIVVVTNNKTEFVKKHLIKNNRMSIWPIIAMIVFNIIQFFLPLEYEFGEGGIVLYAIGDVYFYVVILVVIFGFIGLIAMITGRKNINMKKSVPLIFFVIYEAIIFAVYWSNRTIAIFSLSTTLTSYLMYHTIENPDLKLINELELAKNQAEKSNKAKTDFLSSMSHEIRTPLNAIVGLSQMIEKSSNVEEMHSDSKDILLASQNLLEIVNGILDISKLEANEMQIIENNYNPKEVFDHLVKLIKIRIDEKSLTLRVHYSANLPEVLYGDKEKLGQIVVNLLSNAVKYTDKGYIDFDVDCRIIKDKCTLIITIKDTGRGIRDDQKDNLFKKFYRLEEDRDSDIEGTGLGLAITKSLVELFNGTINVESVFGQGSTFTVQISQKIVKQATADSTEVNYSEGNMEEENSSETLNKNDSYNNSVLVVDDNKINLKVAAKQLSELNMNVDIANSGFECLEQIKEKQYGIIFMDIMMPEMNGVETLHKLREIPGFSSPVVALTADAMNGSREKYLSEGFNEYVSKPFTRETIENVLNNFIKKDENAKNDNLEVL